MNSFKPIHLLLFGIIMFLYIPLQKLNAQNTDMHDHHPVPEGSAIGEIDFRVDCSDEVRADFDHALGMLHHMMYVTSRENFKAIAEKDPDCAMAYWGIATTLFQPLWGTRPGEKELQLGWKNINKALDLAETRREKMLVQSTAEFFREPETADFQTRISRWTRAVERAYETYPDDPDFAAFYGLTRLTIAQSAEEPDPLLDEAEAVLRDIFERIPKHPGAVHYSIHATDVDNRAENALDIVAAYGDIAPAVPHALHMPTHIYVRLGDWSKVIEWNLKSADAALNHPVNGAESHHYLHALDYLVYAYLQRGEDDKAREVYGEVLDKDKYQTSFISAFHFAAIPARLTVERRDWKQAAALEPRTPDYLPWDASPWAEALTWYAKGLGSVHSGDYESAKEAEQKLAKFRDKLQENEAGGMAKYIETDRRVLKGWIELAEGNEEQAVTLMRSAADLESSVEKHPVTPGALQPAHEALGDLLLDLNRPSQALKAYEASEKIWPGRLNTFIGAALAARLAGEELKVRKYVERLLNGSGDSEDESIGEAFKATDQQLNK